jgi:hypothetical protein
VQIGAAGNGVGEELSALERQRAQTLSASSRRRERELSKRASSRRRVVIAAATLIVLAVILVVVFAVGGGSTHHGAASGTASTASQRSHSRSSHAKHASRLPAGAARRGETSVTVLNGTETTGLAHRVSAQLQRNGYSQAKALSGQPPGSNQTTSVQYATGHKADAEGVAQSLGATQTQPLESAVAALAPSASVVVVLGQDKASTSGP